MQRYEITGMSCAACASHLEKAVAAVPGVQSVSVSLLTNSMQVETAPGADETALQKRICRAVESAGYGAAPADDTLDGALDDTETPRLKKRLVHSLCFLVPLMYLSMGHMIGLPLPPFLEGGGAGALVYGLLQLALTVPVCWINRAFFISGWNGLRTKAPGMDALVSLGAGAALVYGVFALVMMAVGLGAGDEAMVLQYRHDLYFESAAMILTLITVGKTLEAYSKGRTTDALKSLMQLTPQTATVLRDGKAVTVPVSEVAVGDIFFVKPGEAVPVDGTVAEGVSSVNEAALTGESMPVDKFPGSPVSAATINQNGALACRAERVGQDTTLSQVIRLVRDAAATKAPLAKTADKVSAIFVPAVIAIAVVTFLVWLLLGQTLAWALARGISVLVISCPCALGLATPVAIMVGSGVGAKHGILFKTAASLETTGYTDTVLLDKTGTITTGEPSVVQIVGTRRVPEKFLLSMAAGLELQSEHPLARAILQRAQDDKIKYTAVANFEAVPGQGLRGKVAGKVIAGGNADFIRTTCVLPPDLEEAGEKMSKNGITPLYFSLAGSPAGVIGVSDVVKKDLGGGHRPHEGPGPQRGAAHRRQRSHRPAHRLHGGPGRRPCGGGGAARRQGGGSPPLAEKGPGGHGGGRHQRCPRPDPGRDRHCHRRRGGRGPGCRRRGAGAQRPGRRAGRGAALPGRGAQHPRKPLLGVFLQRHLHSAGSGHLHGAGHYPESHDCRGGHEPFQRLCGGQRPAAQHL